MLYPLHTPTLYYFVSHDITTLFRFSSPHCDKGRQGRGVGRGCVARMHRMVRRLCCCRWWDESTQPPSSHLTSCCKTYSTLSYSRRYQYIWRSVCIMISCNRDDLVWSQTSACSHYQSSVQSCSIYIPTPTSPSRSISNSILMMTYSVIGVTADISMFAGSVKLQKSLFDCTLAPWDAVVTALTSNTVERSQSVTLIFERELE